MPQAELVVPPDVQHVPTVSRPEAAVEAIEGLRRQA